MVYVGLYRSGSVCANGGAYNLQLQIFSFPHAHTVPNVTLEETRDTVRMLVDNPSLFTPRKPQEHFLTLHCCASSLLFHACISTPCAPPIPSYAAGTQECLYPPSLKDEGKACSSSMLALQSTDRGHSWTDGAGLACTGNASSFEKGSGCPDGFAVDDGGGTGGVHLLWDWNVALGDSTLPHAGLGYSHGASPTGPWTRRATPVNDAWNNTVGPYGFVKLYAGSLIKRSDDWLVVSAIGGSGWAMAAMTSKESPWGPYTQPTTVIYPQSSRYAAIIIVALGFYRVSCGDSGGGGHL